MTKRQTVVVKLRRPSRCQPWGISIAGGADLGTPIIVTRSENEDLQKGDVIKKIDEYDVRDLRHIDAQNLLKNSESVRLVIERSDSLRDYTSHYHSSQSSIFKSIIDDNGAHGLNLPKLAQEQKILPKSPIPPATPIEDDFSSLSSTEHIHLAREHLDEIREERIYLSQPYRTTPLVLPGAKIKKDAPLGECYLRHHPNPMIRAAPHHYEIAHPEVAMKQKVAESVLQRVLGPDELPKVVHKQFNTPIGLYSEQNIADTIKCQASAIPIKKPVKYDPSKSEAYKALQDDAFGDYAHHEIRQPARTGVFSPQRSNHIGAPQPPPRSPASFGGNFRRPFPLPFVKDRVNDY
ncbi:PDZ and LIM domain protein 3 isoform X2 [Leptopilina boulardi]|uniref:PDZ and LIM domain protein 3 isoform X2 n=1 Tax=Leptopilina boulardi TaxID=63433 RepID=UPI0021F5B512|nr:PDZ and LIM domain protein 3 isoform X2 [Leptopilina boulardi]